MIGWLLIVILLLMFPFTRKLLFTLIFLPIALIVGLYRLFNNLIGSSGRLGWFLLLTFALIFILAAFYVNVIFGIIIFILFLPTLYVLIYGFLKGCDFRKLWIEGKFDIVDKAFGEIQIKKEK